MSFQDALSSIMPVDWLDPYGRTPMAPDAELSVDITIVETDDGIKATSVKNPPKAGPGRLIQAIQEALGMAGLGSCEPPCKEKKQDKKKEEQDEPTPPENTGSEHKDRDRLFQNQDEDASQNHA